MYLVSTESNIHLVKYALSFLIHMSRAMTELRAQIPGTNTCITKYSFVGHCHHKQNTWLHVNRIILKGMKTFTRNFDMCLVCLNIQWL